MADFTIVERARETAAIAHRGQYRRDGVTPYLEHPAMVARRVADDPVAASVAWLHDVLEDTDQTAEELLRNGIPVEVVDRVVLLTKQKGMEYEVYLERVKADPIARRVKIADMLSNLSDNPTERQILKYARGLQVLLGDVE